MNNLDQKQLARDYLIRGCVVVNNHVTRAEQLDFVSEHLAVKSKNGEFFAAKEDFIINNKRYVKGQYLWKAD